MFLPRYFTECLGIKSFGFNGTSVSFLEDLNKTTSVLLRGNI